MLLDAIAIVFWPAIVGLVLFGWVRRADISTLATTWAMASMIGMVGIAYTIAFDLTSLVIVFDTFIGMVLFGTLCLVVVYGCRSRLAAGSSVGLILFGAALVGYGSHALIGDHLMERQIVHGTVRQLLFLQTARGPNEYLVSIGDKSFKATTRAFATLREGDRVRVAIGRGSGYIYEIEKAAP